MRAGIVSLALAWSVAACSSSAELTCEVLANPDNCWATAAATAAACLPDPSEVGVLAEDRASCSFSNGARVIFDEPLPQTTEELERLGLTIEVDGASCARFLDTFENRMELEAGGASIVSQLLPGGAFQLQCPGTTYETDFDRLFDCRPMNPPTDGFSVEPELVTFMIISVSTPGELFRCAPAGT